MADERYVGQRIIWARLYQDVTLAGMIGDAIYETDTVPKDAPVTFVELTFLNGEDLLSLNAGARIWSNQLWQVAVRSRTKDRAVVAMVYDRVDTLLNGYSASIGGSAYASGVSVSIHRERQPVLPTDRDGDVVFLSTGGEYRQFVRSA
jgi:hypothetical protein